MSAEKTETKEYSDIRVRKVRILQGEARTAAERVGAGDDDLVILKTSYNRSRLKYAAEKIVGDPVVYLSERGMSTHRPTERSANETKATTEETNKPRQARIRIEGKGTCVMGGWIGPTADGIHMGYYLAKDAVVCSCGWKHRYSEIDQMVRSFRVPTAKGEARQ